MFCVKKPFKQIVSQLKPVKECLLQKENHLLKTTLISFLQIFIIHQMEYISS